MNSDRVDEIAALREQKKLDRQAEVEAREAKEAEEATAHAANMVRIAKKMARIKAEDNTVPEALIVTATGAVEVVIDNRSSITEGSAVKPEAAPKKKKAAVRKPAAKAKKKAQKVKK